MSQPGRHYLALVARAQAKNIPWAAHLELTHRCNLRCRHCFQLRDDLPGEVDTASWKRILGELRAAGTFVVTLSGGEALLRHDFFEIAAHARSLGLALRIFTNGLLLTEENALRIAALRPLAVEVSVFSVRAAIHDRVTTAPGSLEKALAGVRRLRALEVPVLLKAPLLDENTPHHQELEALARALGCEVSFDPGIVPRFDGDVGVTRCRAAEPDLEQFFGKPEVRAREEGRREPKRADEPVCGIARSFAVVNPSADMVPCAILAAPAGNVLREGVARVWREAPLMKKLRGVRWGDLHGCAGCGRSGYCDRCGAVALLEDADFAGPSRRACATAELKERAYGWTAPIQIGSRPQPAHRVVERIGREEIEALAGGDAPWQREARRGPQAVAPALLPIAGQGGQRSGGQHPYRMVERVGHEHRGPCGGDVVRPIQQGLQRRAVGEAGS